MGESRAVTMTPDEAKAEIKRIQGEAASNKEHAYNNKLHPEHAAIVKRLSYLHQMAYPEPVTK